MQFARVSDRESCILPTIWPRNGQNGSGADEGAISKSRFVKQCAASPAMSRLDGWKHSAKSIPKPSVWRLEPERRAFGSFNRQAVSGRHDYLGVLSLVSIMVRSLSSAMF